jgi:hypothetical protein
VIVWRPVEHATDAAPDPSRGPALASRAQAVDWAERRVDVIAHWHHPAAPVRRVSRDRWEVRGLALTVLRVKIAEGGVVIW